MKRLREIEPHSELLRKARSLLDAAEPLPESDARRLRIRRALDRPRASGMRLPAFGLAMLIGLFGASAFAALGIYVAIEPSSDRAAPAPAKDERAPRPKRTKPPKAAPAQATGSAQPAEAEPLPSYELPKTGAPDREGARPRAGGRQATRAQDSANGEAAAATDSELVHRAVKALRRDRDPALAARLLEQHRARSPEGPLSEEALSLQIEAALALHEPRAATLAREYLARYPHGRYTAVAHRALGRGADPDGPR